MTNSITNNTTNFADAHRRIRSSSKTTCPPTKRVRFHRYDTIFTLHPPRQSFLLAYAHDDEDKDEDHRRRLWYQDDERKVIAMSNQATVKRMMRLRVTQPFPSDEDDDTNEYECFDGLDIPCHEIRRRIEISHAQLAVFTEQEFQQEDGIYDPELLADAYYSVTRLATHQAIQRARQLVEEEQEVLTSTTSTSTTLSSFVDFYYRTEKPRQIQKG